MYSSCPKQPLDKCSPIKPVRPVGLDCILSEFSALPMGVVCHRSCSELFASALSRENIGKNRYPDVLPFESSRVHLSTGEYINASYIVPCATVDLRYIATQAPMPNTFNEFWLMVWEANVSVMVMLTKFLERRKIKAHCYWPCDFGEQEIFGDISVQLMSIDSEDESAIVLRSFKLTNCATGESRICTHIHFTEWPDFGVPRTTTTIRKVLNLIDCHRTPGSTTLVHCSAGIGRAGTLIAIHSFLARFAHGETSLTIRQVVEELRQFRAGMVQTKEQYLFIFQTLDDLLLEPPRSERSFSSNSISTRQPLRSVKYAPSVLSASESAIHHPIDSMMTSVVSCI